MHITSHEPVTPIHWWHHTPSMGLWSWRLNRHTVYHQSSRFCGGDRSGSGAVSIRSNACSLHCDRPGPGLRHTVVCTPMICSRRRVGVSSSDRMSALSWRVPPLSGSVGVRRLLSLPTSIPAINTNWAGSGVGVVELRNNILIIHSSAYDTTIEIWNFVSRPSLPGFISLSYQSSVISEMRRVVRNPVYHRMTETCL